MPRQFLYFRESEFFSTMREDLLPVCPCGCEERHIANGPSGSAGTLAKRSDIRDCPDAFLLVNLMQQRWLQTGNNIWVGYWASSKPGPGDLYVGNRATLGITECALGDGNIWQIPNLLKLPEAIAELPDGSLGLRVLSEFEDLAEWRDKMIEVARRVEDGEADSGLDIQDVFLALSAALSKLYCVGRREVAALELVNTDPLCAGRILKALAGIPSNG